MSAWAIIEREDKLLLVQRSENTSRAGQWCFPGGGVKAGEEPRQACVREALEETGLSIRVRKLVSSENDENYFLCNLVDPEQELVLKLNECSNFKWAEPKDLLSLGVIMNLRKIIPLLSSLGYDVILTDEAIKYLS